MPNTIPTTRTPATLGDRQPATLLTGQQPLIARHPPLWLPTWAWVAILAGMDLVTTVVGLATGDHEANPAATIVGGVSIFLAIKVVLTAAMCWRWRRLGEKHWSRLSRVTVLGILIGIVIWNISVIARG